MDRRTRFLGWDTSTARRAVPMAGSVREQARQGTISHAPEAVSLLIRQRHVPEWLRSANPIFP
jgi:hypothetical protein